MDGSTPAPRAPEVNPDVSIQPQSTKDQKQKKGILEKLKSIFH
jgi:hypothetical protein